MSREYHQFAENYHEDLASAFKAGEIDRPTVQCRIADKIYVYIYEGETHVQTQHVNIPEAWNIEWPSDATVRRYVHRYADIGSARITSLSA